MVKRKVWSILLALSLLVCLPQTANVIAEEEFGNDASFAEAPDTGDAEIAGNPDGGLDGGSENSGETPDADPQGGEPSNEPNGGDNEAPGDPDGESAPAENPGEDPDDGNTDDEDAKEGITVIIENTTFTDYSFERIEVETDFDVDTSMTKYLEDATMKSDTGDEDREPSFTVKTIDKIDTITEVNGLRNGLAGEESGWIPVLNDELLEEGTGVDDYIGNKDTLHDGDTIKLLYSLDGGIDLGLVDEEMVLEEELALYGKQFGNGYTRVEGLDNAEFVTESWRFSDSLYPTFAEARKSGDSSLALANISGSADQRFYEMVFAKAYTYYKDSTKYDIHVKLTPIELPAGSTKTQSERFPIGSGGTKWGDWKVDTANNFEGATNGNNTLSHVIQNVNGNSSKVTFMTIRPEAGTENSKKAFEYEVWLTHPTTNERVNNIPFVVGSCYDANSSAYERLQIYTNHKVGDKYRVSTSIPVKTFEYSNYTDRGEDFSGFLTPRMDYDQPYYYLLGQGYTSETNRSVYGAYTTTNNSGALELRMGYKSYSIDYVVIDDSHSGDTDTNKVKVPETEFVPVPNGSTYYYPSQPSITKADDLTDKIAYLKIGKIYDGEPAAYSEDANQGKTVTLKNGKKLKVGDVISFADKDLIADIQMTHNVEIEVHLVGEDAKVNLLYTQQNSVIPGENINQDYDSKKYLTGNMDQTPGVKPANKSKYKKGDTVIGTDGIKYVLRGWKIGSTAWVDNPPSSGTLKDAPEFIFGQTVLTEDTYIFADWVPAVTLSFDPQAPGVKVPPSQNMPVGDKGVRPPDPARPGFEFIGWFLDPEGKIPFSFDTPITEDTKIYGLWRAVSSSFKAVGMTIMRSPKTGFAGRIFLWFLPIIICSLGLASTFIRRRPEDE